VDSADHGCRLVLTVDLFFKAPGILTSPCTKVYKVYIQRNSPNILAFRQPNPSAFQHLTFIAEKNFHSHQLSPTSLPTLIFPSSIMKVTNALLVGFGLLLASVSALPMKAEEASTFEHQPGRRYTLSSPAATTDSDEPPTDVEFYGPK